MQLSVSAVSVNVMLKAGCGHFTMLTMMHSSDCELTAEKVRSHLSLKLIFCLTHQFVLCAVV